MNKNYFVQEFSWIDEYLLNDDPEVHKMSLYLTCTKGEKVYDFLTTRKAFCISGEWFISSPDGSSYELWEDIRAWLEGDM